MLKSLFAAASQAGVKQSWVTENTLFPEDIPCLQSFLFLVMYINKMKHNDFESPEMHAGTKLTKQIKNLRQKGGFGFLLAAAVQILP